MDDQKVRVQGQDLQVYVEQKNPDIRMYYEYTGDHFRKGQDYNLKVFRFSTITGFERRPRGLTMQIRGDVLYNTQMDSDGELRPMIDTHRPPEHFDAWLALDVCEDGVFRLRAGKGTAAQQHDTVMLEGVAPLPEPEFSFWETRETLELATARYRAVLTRSPFSFALYTVSGKRIYTQENDDRVLDFTFESFPFGFVENPETGEKIAVCTGRMEHDERFYGFGEQYSKVEKTGQEVDVFITDPLSVGSARTYVSLPFYFSSAGYGLYWNTHFRSKFFMGNRSNRAISAHVYGDAVMDLFYFCGETPGEILERYTDITGKSPKLPAWSYGLWMSRCSYRTQAEVLAVAEELRRHEIPCDVLNIDTDWFAQPWACDWQFGPDNFPDPKAMFDQLAEMGFKVSLWQKPYLTAERLPYLTAELDAKGWLPHNEAGRMSRANPVLDFSNPECREWYKDKLKALMRLGAKVIKTDMGEGAAPEGVYHQYSGAEMHNIYTYLYARTAWEATIEAQGEGLLWGRSTYAGGQKYPIHWAGDPFCTYDGLRFSIRSGLSMGLSGFTYWSHDIGGFLGRPDARLYVRWAQAGMFCSHARCHGANNPREPWTFGAEAEAIFRKYDRLRYRLLAYIQETAEACAGRGLPVMAHMLLHYPGDRTCWQIEDQWMFGDQLMVAPVLSDRDEREVYFPDDLWYDFADHRVADTGWQTVHAPLEHLPLYVRGGSILPMIAAQEAVPSEAQPVSLTVFAKDSGTSTLNLRGVQVRAKFEKGRVTLSVPQGLNVSQIEAVPPQTECVVVDG